MFRKESKINQELKSVIDMTIKKFLDDDSQKEYKFPSSLSSEERKYIHDLAQKLGLKTKSRGNKVDRYLTLFKLDDNLSINESYFDLKESSKFAISSAIENFPLTAQERRELNIDKFKTTINQNEPLSFKDLSCTIGRLSDVIPQVPSRSNYNLKPELTCFRQSLPIWKMREEIMELINVNQVVIVSGDTGCGKTTQIPQFILEDCMINKKCCRIIATQPRRLAALSIADRVAEEIGESVGQMVGYQIKLESKVSPRTLLTFCTHGVLLRTLMSGKNSLANVTHIIIDEVHERDRFSDFLLLILKTQLVYQKHVKLILMSATIDTEKFINYFDNCQYVNVPQVSFNVQVYFLSDILAATGYKSFLLKSCDFNANDKSNKKKKLIEWCQKAEILNQFQSNKKEASTLSLSTELINEKLTNCGNIKAQMDISIRNAWIAGDDEHFEKLLSLIINENYPIDYKHSETGTTALIAATYKRKLKIVETLLGLGANVKMCDARDWNAFHWAKYLNHHEIVDLFEAYFNYYNQATLTNVNKESEELVETKEGKQLIEAYSRFFPNEDEIDIDLIIELIHNICMASGSSTPSIKGTILIFLPGYNEIVSVRDRILSDDRLPQTEFALFTLHSQMQNGEQRKVFEPAKPGVRKIILSTNLSETSITINDVFYVIDSGKVKEKFYDKILGATILKSVWISQSSAIQRRGRAGRCQNGVCFHLYSKDRFSTLSKFHVPEILRMPLHELCLQSKFLAPKDMSILDFLVKTIDSPSISTIQNSINLLKSIDALDQNEKITEIGLHLLDLPIEPNLGKMILNAVVLKCLDPVLTIVCGLSYRDPFIIYTDPNKKKALNEARKKLSAGTLSDHMVFLRLFQQWQKSRIDGYEKSFLEQNCVRVATMEMIGGMRAQLLGQLRASGFVRSKGSGNIRDLNVNSEKWAVVKAALTAGAYPNLFQLDGKRCVSSKGSRICFHPSSVLQVSLKSNATFKKTSKVNNMFSSNWFIFEEMIKIGHLSYAQCCTIVTPLSVALFAGHNRCPSDSLVKKDLKLGQFGLLSNLDSDSENEEKSLKDKSLLEIDDWISFRLDPIVANLIYQLRIKWQLLFSRRMRSPSKPFHDAEEHLIKCIVDVIAEEEEILGIQQPSGIGQRPKPVSLNFGSPFGAA